MSVRNTLAIVSAAFFDAYKHGDKARVNIGEAQLYANSQNLNQLKNNPIQVHHGKRVISFRAGDERLGGGISKNYAGSLERIFSSGFHNRLKGQHV